MQRQQIQLYLSAFGLIGIMLTMAACFNEPNFSNTPNLTAHRIFNYDRLPAQRGVGRGLRDSVVVEIDFEEGDGNLGNDLPLTSKADSIRYASSGWGGNYRIRAFRLERGQYTAFDLPVNTTLFFPDLAKGKPKGPITGTIYFNQTFLYGNSFQLYPIKFQVTIRDRDLNESNTIETDTVTVPLPR